MTVWKQVEQDISTHLGRAFRIIDKHTIGGGSINNAHRISDSKESFFVKMNRQQLGYMFEAEMRALDELNNTQCIKVPQPVSCGVFGHESYIIMSWIDISGNPDGSIFGGQLAALHKVTATQFGFDIDNTIGSTPQLNQWSNDWLNFWGKQRLVYQLDLARNNGHGHRLYDLGLKLKDNMGLFFSNYQPQPSLLHGDLWSGNWGADEKGNPVIFDPAIYYGDRETDLAMMELFGHPGQKFFSAYNEHFPLHEGYSVRKNFYNLYHILNHANLFGSSYASQAENMMESLLAEVRA
jgi:fructosamine-3-kinase